MGARHLLPVAWLALGACGPHDPPSPPTLQAPAISLLPCRDRTELTRKLKASDVGARRAAAQLIARMCARAPEVLPAILDAVKDPDSNVRFWAATAVRHMGPAAKSATAAMMELMKNDPDNRVREAAAYAFLPIESEIQVIRPALEAALRDPDSSVRRYAMDTLRHFDPGVRRSGESGGGGPGGPARSISQEPPDWEPEAAIGGQFQSYGGQPSGDGAPWSHFRGGQFDNTSCEDLKLADRWPAAGPRLLWKTPVLSEGYSGSVIQGGRVYTCDYDPREQAECVRCLSLGDGKEIWRRWHTVKLINNHGFTRSTPAVTEDYVVTIGALGQVLCLGAEGGDLRWGLDLVKQFSLEVPDWYSAQSPVIDGSTAVFAVGSGDTLLMGVDCFCGRIDWRSPNPRRWKWTHSSVTPMRFAGKRLYLYVADGGLAAVSGEPESAGRPLCETTDWSPMIPSASPAVLEDGHIYLTSGHRAGGLLLRLEERAGKLGFRTVWKKPVEETLASEFYAPIFSRGSLFGTIPDDGGKALRRQFACMNPFDGGKIVWSSGAADKVGPYQPVLLADGKLIVLNQSGELMLIRAASDRFELLDKAKVSEGRDAWAAMALSSGRLILKDSKNILCIDLRP